MLFFHFIKSNERTSPADVAVYASGICEEIGIGENVLEGAISEAFNWLEENEYIRYEGNHVLCASKYL